MVPVLREAEAPKVHPSSILLSCSHIGAKTSSIHACLGMFLERTSTASVLQGLDPAEAVAEHQAHRTLQIQALPRGRCLAQDGLSFDSGSRGQRFCSWLLNLVLVARSRLSKV